MALLRHALRPAHLTALLLIATLTLLLSIASLAGLPGLPLMVIVLSWLFKYAYVLLDLSAEGIAEPPVLSAEMVNPVEQRPLMQLAICGAGFGLAWWIGGAPYNYTPVPDGPGFDALVTGLRIAPTGTMNAASGAGQPFFTIRLRVRIQ